MDKIENSSFDITKIILSIMIVAIHAQIYPNILFPWLRIAVPLFFMISSYFLFTKINKLKIEEEKEQSIKRYIQRNLKLYFFWFIVLLIPTLIIREYFAEKNILLGICRILKGFAFSSTFKASWYIMSSIIATPIIYNLSKKIKNKTLLAITLVIYILICIRSSYSFILNNFPIIESICNGFEHTFAEPWNSFPVAFFWIACGKCFAEKTIDISKNKNIIILITSTILLYIEWYIIKNISGKNNNDCYLLLAPLSISIFNIIKNIKPFKIKYTKELRNMSTVIYATHATIIASTKILVKYIRILNNANIVFLLTILTCICTYFIIKILEKRKYMKFLKYSY